ncbi:MAG: leucine-rich repeat protein, partial [Bacteroidales bacterium]|nr:leucine-rich repeat protein [Bacteroidales bacterium]
MEQCAFAMCERLTSVSMGSNVINYGSMSFSNCYALTSFTNLNPTPVGLPSDVFQGIYQKNCTLKVPKGSVAAYKNAAVWKDFNIVGIDVGIETNEIDAVKIYPNPTDGELMIENGEWELKSVEIFDIYGRKLSQIPSSTSLPP